MSDVIDLPSIERAPRLATRPPSDPPPSDRPIAIRIQAAHKQFGANAVLRGLDLTIEEGEFVAIVGRSGCGKTTLLRAIAGLEDLSSGSIEFSAVQPVRRLMFQDARLLPWRRVLENVAIGRRHAEWRQEALAALARVGLEAKAEHWPAHLSGGQRQRVALARALVSEPNLLLLDEPLGALDAITRLEMQELIERVWRTQRFTAVLVTHDVIEAVSLASRVIVLEHGRIAESWTIDLPRPRPRASAELARIEAAILERLLRQAS